MEKRYLTTFTITESVIIILFGLLITNTSFEQDRTTFYFDSIKVAEDGRISFSSLTSQKSSNRVVIDSSWYHVSASITEVSVIPSVTMSTGNMIMMGDGFQEEKKTITPAGNNLFLVVSLELKNANNSLISFRQDDIKFIGDKNISKEAMQIIKENNSELKFSNGINFKIKPNSSVIIAFSIEVPKKFLTTLRLNVGGRNFGKLNQFNAWQKLVSKQSKGVNALRKYKRS